MGRMAASGAYWLSADADEIWASDDTLTGSIGIFMALPTFENMLNHAGIYQDGIGTTNLAGAFDLARPLSPEIKKTLQLSLENNYMKFISIVASGRQLPLETVEKLAQGKVYSGSTALELKLVDKIGSLDRAIAAAAEKAGLIHYDVTLLTPSMTLTEKFFYNFNTKITGNIVEHLPFGRALVELTKKTIIPTATNRRDPQSMYAHCMLDY
nr:MAG: hypothetical protein CR981_02415 [Pseudomonadota bacterium]